MALVFLVVLIILGIGVTDVLAFGPLALLNLLHIPQWLGWALVLGAIAWFMGRD